MCIVIKIKKKSERKILGPEMSLVSPICLLLHFNILSSAHSSHSKYLINAYLQGLKSEDWRVLCPQRSFSQWLRWRIVFFAFLFPLLALFLPQGTCSVKGIFKSLTKVVQVGERK